MRKTMIAIAMMVVLPVNALADSREVAWNRLAPFVLKRNVQVSLIDGTRIEGKVAGISEREMSIQVHRSSDRSRHAIGSESISTQEISSLKVRRSTKRWRVVGTLVGAAAGFPAGVVGAIEKEGLFSKNSGTGIFVLIMGGLTGAGFLIGWAADHHSTTITISPEPH